MTELSRCNAPYDHAVLYHLNAAFESFLVALKIRKWWGIIESIMLINAKMTILYRHIVYFLFLYTQSIGRNTRCPEKTDTIIFCYNSENKRLIFKNYTCLYWQKHGKTDCRCHMTCTTPGQSRQLLKADARCKPPSGGLALAAARSAVLSNISERRRAASAVMVV